MKVVMWKNSKTFAIHSSSHKSSNLLHIQTLKFRSILLFFLGIPSTLSSLESSPALLTTQQTSRSQIPIHKSHSNCAKISFPLLSSPRRDFISHLNIKMWIFNANCFFSTGNVSSGYRFYLLQVEKCRLSINYLKQAVMFLWKLHIVICLQFFACTERNQREGKILSQFLAFICRNFINLLTGNRRSVHSVEKNWSLVTVIKCNLLSEEIIHKRFSHSNRNNLTNSRRRQS